MEASPLISVIIPYRKRSVYLDECLSHLKKLSDCRIEIILLPDGEESFDGLSNAHQVIATGPLGPARKRDIGCKHARGEFFAFIDDDAYPDPGWLCQAVSHFKNLRVAAVTGPAVTPASDHLLQHASGLIYSTILTGGHCTHRYRPKPLREVDDAASVNLIVRKTDYNAVGGFNTHYYPGEDTKLCLDFTQNLKKKIIYDPNVLVWHHRRSLFLPHLKQVSQYALHRGYFVKKYPKNSLKLNYFLPSAFAFYMLILGCLAVLDFDKALWFSLPLVLYSILILLLLLVKRSLTLSIATWIGSLITHFAYGVYFLKGLFSLELKR